MIVKTGVVLINEHDVTVIDFAFNGVDLRQGAIEAIDWAIARLIQERDSKPSEIIRGE